MAVLTLKDFIIPVPDRWGGDGRWDCGHLWSGRQPAAPRYSLSNSARAHTGLDIAGNQGTFIVSPAAGIIESWGWSDAGGWTVVVRHRVMYKGKMTYVWSRHSHCLQDRLIEIGQTVGQGDHIALLGSTGGSASPHNHTGLTLVPYLPAWNTQAHLFLDPEPIYYPGRYAYVQRGHPFPKEVKKLQSRLNAVGFTPPLKVDGDYGPRTEEGVKWFQGKVLIEQSGSASELTLVLLWDKKVVKDG